MTPLTLVASLATTAALGAAGYATFSGTQGNSLADVAAATSDAAQPEAALASGAKAEVTVVQKLPAPASSGDEPASPRECRPEDGVDRDCTYE